MTKIRPAQVQPSSTNGHIMTTVAGVAAWAVNAGLDAEAVRDIIGTALVAGTGATVTVNDAADTITIAVDTTTEAERVRDAIGAALVAGTGITVTVNDAGDIITTAVDTATEAERIRDVMGTALVAGANVTLTVNDAGDQIMIASTGGGGGGSGGHTVMDEGSALTARTYLDFVGTGVAVTDDLANDKTVVTISGAGGGGFSGQNMVFSQSGVLSVTTDTDASRWYNRTGASLTIGWVSASVGSQPVGSGVTVDVNVNGTTIFTTQANRPTIAAGGNVSSKVTNHDVTTVPNNGYITVNVDAVGGTYPGGNLVVEVGLA